MASSPAFTSASLYVGSLDPEATEALLFEVFNAVGPVASVRICRDTATRRSLGYGYVNFHRAEHAERALDSLNFKMIRNQKCRIMRSERNPALRKSGLGNLFIKNLAKSIDEKQLFDTFGQFGSILSCKVATGPKRESLGYGFVHYEKNESAVAAIKGVSGNAIAGQKVLVTPFKSKAERGGGLTKFTNIFAKNIHPDVTKEEFEALFGQHGVISSSKFAVDDEGKPKGFGFVDYQKAEEAQAAIEALNNFDLKGQKLYAGRAQKKEEREVHLRARFEKLRLERQKELAGVNLYVKNLSDHMDEEALRKQFGEFGSITSCKVMREGSRSRGFGFVCFSAPEEATRAVTAMNGRTVDTKPLYVALAQTKEERRALLEAQHTRRQNVLPQHQMYPGGFYQPQPFMRQNQQWLQPMRAGMMPQMLARPVHARPQQPYPATRTAFQAAAPNVQRAPATNPTHYATRPVAGAPPVSTLPAVSSAVPSAAAAAAAASLNPAEPASSNAFVKLLASSPEQMKQLLGEALYPMVKKSQPELAGKITGMLLEMATTDLLILLDNEQAREDKIREAVAVLAAHSPPAAAAAGAGAAAVAPATTPDQPTS